MTHNSLRHYYRLPWSEEDNPNGWIEPATFCNIHCPGCYRGSPEPGHVPEELAPRELKKQIDWFIRCRNIHTLSIAGGEPLLYPPLDEIVRYANGKNLRVMIYTNGLILDEKRITELETSGVTQIMIHIDRFQKRPDMKPGMRLNDLRLHFCNLFRDRKTVKLGFIQPVSAQCRDEISSIIDFANVEIDVVNLVVISLYRDICWDSRLKEKIDTRITINEVVEFLKRKEGYAPASYLASENDPEDITWLFAIKAGLKNRVLGFFSPSLYRYIHERYRRASGRYLFISRQNVIKPRHLLKYFWSRSIRKIAHQYYKAAVSLKPEEKSSLYFQTILLLRGPELRNNTWDLCNACPDRIIHNGKLLPSCILNDLKKKANELYMKVELE